MRQWEEKVSRERKMVSQLAGKQGDMEETKLAMQRMAMAMDRLEGKERRRAREKEDILMLLQRALAVARTDASRCSS